MGVVLGLIFPTLIIIFPLILLVAVGIKMKRVGRIVFSLVLLGCFLLGIIAPIYATEISIKGLMSNFGPDEPICVTGSVVFLFFGYFVNLVVLPLVGIGLFPPRKKSNV